MKEQPEMAALFLCNARSLDSVANAATSLEMTEVEWAAEVGCPT